MPSMKTAINSRSVKKAAGEIETALGDIDNAARKTTDEVRAVEGQIERFGQTAHVVTEESVARFDARLNQLLQSGSLAGGELQRLGLATGQTAVGFSGLLQPLTQLANSINTLQTDQARQGFEDLRDAATKAFNFEGGLSGAVKGMASLGEIAIDTARSFGGLSPLFADTGDAAFTLNGAVKTVVASFDTFSSAKQVISELPGQIQSATAALTGMLPMLAKIGAGVAIIGTAALAWEFGSWAYDQFAIVQRGAEYARAGVAIIWEHLKHGAKVAFIGIGEAWDGIVNTMLKSASWFIQKVHDLFKGAAGLLAKVGLDIDTSALDKLQEIANAIDEKVRASHTVDSKQFEPLLQVLESRKKELTLLSEKAQGEGQKLFEQIRQQVTGGGALSPEQMVALHAQINELYSLLESEATNRDVDPKVRNSAQTTLENLRTDITKALKPIDLPAGVQLQLANQELEQGINNQVEVSARTHVDIDAKSKDGSKEQVGFFEYAKRDMAKATGSVFEFVQQLGQLGESSPPAAVAPDKPADEADKQGLADLLGQYQQQRKMLEVSKEKLEVEEALAKALEVARREGVVQGQSVLDEKTKQIQLTDEYAKQLENEVRLTQRAGAEKDLKDQLAQMEHENSLIGKSQSEVMKLNHLWKLQKQDIDANSEGIRSYIEQIEEASKKAVGSELKEELKEERFQTSLIGLSPVEQARRKMKKRLEEEKIPLDGELGNELLAETEENVRRREEMEKLKQLADGVGEAFGNAFSNMVLGAKSAKEAIRGLYEEIARLVVQQMVAKPIADAISGGIQGMFGGGGDIKLDGQSAPSIWKISNATGNVFDRDRLVAFAMGGALDAGKVLGTDGPSLSDYRNRVVNRPTLFVMAQGKRGLMGEAGPEAIVPLSRDRRGLLGIRSDTGGILPLTRIGGRLGVRTEPDHAYAYGGVFSGGRQIPSFGPEEVVRMQAGAQQPANPGAATETDGGRQVVELHQTLNVYGVQDARGFDRSQRQLLHKTRQALSQSKGGQ